MDPSRTPPSQVRCSICDQRFGRQEHLNRHLRIHTQEKPYQCSLCEKRFSRLDVLNRHTVSHEYRDNGSAATASSRACKQCAIDRVRCSRGRTCKRCLERKLPCRYPSARGESMRAPDRGEDERSEFAGTFLDQAGIHPLAAGPGAQPTQVADDNMTAPIFAHAMESSADDSLAWMNTVDSIENLYDLGQPGLGVSGVNWMSPQYHQALDWETLITGFAVDNGAYSTQHETHDEGGQGRAEGTIDDANTSPHLQQQQQQEQRQAELDPEAEQSRGGADASPSSNANVTEGRYYVHGAGARAPFGGRSHDRCSTGAIHSQHEVDSNGTTFSQSPQPSAKSPQPAAADSLCPKAVYDNLIQGITIESQLQSLDIDIACLPSHHHVQLFVRHYFDNFHSIFPFLRKASFTDDALSEWLLLLAVSVVGSRYTRRLQGREPSKKLFHLLHSTLQHRRYGFENHHNAQDEGKLFIPGQSMAKSVRPSLQVLQSAILNIICMLHSGNEVLVERAFIERHYTVEACHLLELISQSPEETGLGSATNNFDQEFIQKWLTNESKIRTGMMIWFLDSMFLFEFDANPLIQLGDVKSNLPSHEDVWEDPRLVQQGKQSFSNVTLLVAMEILYVEKRLPSNLGEFGAGLLINAIYRNTKQILARENIRLNSWTPTVTPQQRLQQSSAQQNWLSPTPLMSKWRNSACDCLDVLHWPANSRAAQFFGSEHHTILLLHLARLIILTPTTCIQLFATESASANQHSNDPQSKRRHASARRQVLQWIISDRFKARLSIIHCGAIYWHVRRYSCDSVLEPYAIYAATLILWAFCVSMQLPEVVAAMSHASEDDPDPSFLHLDRPLDDELVQTFVRLGHKMSAYISKVGSIQDRDAPIKVLQEGISLLGRDSDDALTREHTSPHPAGAPCPTWGIEESFTKSLYDLMNAKAHTNRTTIA